MDFKTNLITQRKAAWNEASALLERAKGFNRDLSSGEETRYNELNATIDELDERLKAIAENEKRGKMVDEALARFGGVNGSGSTRKNDGFDQGRRSIDQNFRSGYLTDAAAEKAMGLVDVGAPGDRSLAARWAAAAGSEAYLRAFQKIVCSERGHLLWTAEEGDAFRAAEAVHNELRAMSLTDGNGGYMVPLTLDPSIILTSAGSINPMRKIARVVTTVTDQWQGVTSAGVTAEWIAEATQVADASPTVDDAPIPVYKSDAFVPFSFEVGDDVPNFVSEIQRVMIDGLDQLHATAYTTGAGSTQPTGIVTALAGTASEIAPATPETFAAADVYRLIEAVPPRFRANAQWTANLSVLDLIDQFETTNGAKKFPHVAENPATLLRRRVEENSNMDGAWNVAASADNHILICGDFSNYVIVDRIGSTFELVPHLFGANGRPTGQRGALLWHRTGGDCVNINAFRMLNLETTA